MYSEREERVCARGRTWVRAHALTEPCFCGLWAEFPESLSPSRQLWGTGSWHHLLSDGGVPGPSHARVHAGVMGVPQEAPPRTLCSALLAERTAVP